tara:strand:- start:472 stop:723 length:252 start_codon:yes stop_codon:yes gene_type:complete
MAELCPMHCINASCKDPTFLQLHETFVISIVGIGGSALGIMLSYFLKSRCRKIKVCFGLFSCDRVPIELPVESADVTVESNNA